MLRPLHGGAEETREGKTQDCLSHEFTLPLPFSPPKNNIQNIEILEGAQEIEHLASSVKTSMDVLYHAISRKAGKEIV